MNEIARVLEPKEKVEWEGKPDAKAYFISLFAGVIIFGGIFLTIIILSGKLNFWGYIISGLAILILVLGSLTYRNLHYAITNKRVILQRGIIGRDFKFDDYDQIKNVSVNVGIIGLIFKVGNIKIFTGELDSASEYGSTGVKRSTGVKSAFDSFAHIKNPYEVIKDLQSHLSKRKEDLYAGRT